MQVLKPAKSKNAADVDMVDEGNSGMEAALLAEADPLRREDLTCENQLDPLEGEQTWPTDEELAEATAKAGLFVYPSPSGMFRWI